MEFKTNAAVLIGADAGTGHVHTITATPANVHDITDAHKLLREDDEAAYGDSGYIGPEKRDKITNDDHFSKIDFRLYADPEVSPVCLYKFADVRLCKKNILYKLWDKCALLRTRILKKDLWMLFCVDFLIKISVMRIELGIH